jgi:filamentous hemagglutinin family protein
LGLGIASLEAFINPCFAQSSNIVPDDSLGADSSQVDENFLGLPLEVITGGAQRGINLFHSFREFNVSEGRGAYFFSPNAEIQNILTRVTGRNPSEILGTLGTFGNSQPNLFLINPNGIVFGENASLDVGGSFVASTANGIEFGEQGVFSATNPETPRLLNVSPSALFFNAVNNQAEIQNNSVAPAGTDPAGFDVFGLRVADGKSLLLVGGDVSMDGGQLNAYGGRVELGGLAAPGNVNLLFDEDNLKLGFPENVTRADVSLTNQAFVYVEADGGGDIAINARNLDILQGSQLSAGIGQGLGTRESVAGDITLNATDKITIANPMSRVYNDVTPGAIGNSGDINIIGKSVEINDGGRISASTFGKGNAGSINITIGSLFVSNGAQIQSFVFEEGNSGNIEINASESIEVTGNVDSNNSSLTKIASQVSRNSTGRSGNLLLNTRRLTVKDGGQIQASTFSEVSTAKSGTINVNASESIEISGTNGDTIPSRLFTGTYGGADGSDLNINTEKLSILNGGIVSASTAAWLGEGKGGNLTVNAKDSVEISGFVQNGSNIFLSVLAAETGRLFNQNAGRNLAPGGNLTINTRKLNISNNGRVSTETYMSAGKAGDLTVNATDSMDIVGSNSRLSSRTNGRGDAGNLKIRTQKLAIREGAEVSSSSSLANEDLLIRRGGNAGTVDVDATESVELTGLFSGLVSFSLFSTGDAGRIKLNTGRLLISDGAAISTNSLGTGKGGDIEINAADFIEISGSGSYFGSDISPALAKETGLEQVIEKSNLSALTGTKEDAGNITINTGRLFLKDGGEITANTLNEGKGGNINIQVNSAFLDNNASINGSSGITQIDPEKNFGDAGNISINARDSLTVTDSTISTISKQSSGGAINITAGDIRLFGDSDIATNVFSGEGGGGNINLTANTIIALDDSDILSFASDGNGGDIQFNTAGFFSEALYRQTSTTDANALTLLDGNNRTDLNASGAVSGAITGVPVTFIDEELTDLPENQIDTNALIANSCIARGTKRQENSFKITGSGGLRNSPADGFISEYSTGDVRNVEPTRGWKKGDAIIEPQGLYQLPDGRLLLSRDC